MPPKSDAEPTSTLTQTRGIRCFEVAGRPSPFAVQWRSGGKTKTETFVDSKDSDKRAGELIRAQRRGELDLMLTRAEADDCRALMAAIGTTPWPEIIAAWRRDLQASAAAPAGPGLREMVKQAVKEALDEHAAADPKRIGQRPLLAYLPPLLTTDEFAFLARLHPETVRRKIRYRSIKSRSRPARIPCKELERFGVDLEAAGMALAV
jgi:hypothetical protein